MRAVDGVHDLGGKHGYGAVEVEADEPVFHHDWERLARALTYAAVAGMPNANTSAFRHVIERMEPGHYLASSYYERWLTAAATIAVESGLVTHEELERRAGGRFRLSRAPLVDEVESPSHDGRDRRFQVGDRVRVRDWHPPGHTRCPGYTRGKVGVVTRCDGAYTIPDVEAHSPARPAEPTYSVRFDAEELWHDGQRGVTVNVDLWDSYLEET
jgi:nitrile hydratase subunit beta